MDKTDDFEPEDEGPRYEAPGDIDPSALWGALCGLHLLGDDPFLRMQVFNLQIVDQFLTDLEYQVLRQLIEEERTPASEASLLSAQSQMWIFAAYELMRTWRQRVKDMIKWHENGGLKLKLAEFEKEQGYKHFGRTYRAEQIKSVLSDPAQVDALHLDLRRTHIVFVRLEAIRISLAKHEVWKKGKSPALNPGYGRINMWCGSLDYELENGLYSMGTINRRDIADEIRAFPGDDVLPTDEDIAAFDEFMRGPATPPPA